MLIDTHCHLDFPQFDEDRIEVIARAKTAGVSRMITIGCHVEAAQKAVRIAEENDGVFAALGIHPDEAGENFDKDFEVIKQLADNPKVVAIGETGLDLYRPENPPLTKQIFAFERHIELAQALMKPVIIHLRSARNELAEFLTEHHDFPFVIHCYSEDWDFAQQVFDWGGMISFTGIVTFKNANAELLEVAKKAPIERIMVETDAPFLAPVPKRGKRCEPAFTRSTAEFLAEQRGEDFAAFARQTTANAEGFFGI